MARKSLTGTLGEVSPQIKISIPKPDLEALDAYAGANRFSRSEAVRRLARAALAPTPPTGALQQLPILGHVAAGVPIFADQNIEGWIAASRLTRRGEVLFALRVKGDSMVNAGIFDGSLVIIQSQDTARDNDIVLALIDGADATIKRIKQEKRTVLLIPENDDLQPMRYPAHRVQIQGRVIETRHVWGE